VTITDKHILFDKSHNKVYISIMTWELISATPSPYARKVRIALQEKNLPFELKTEVPWDNTTQTPQYNPLEKLPVLIFNDGRPAVYESHFILEWLETKYPEPSLLPSIEDADDRLFVKQVEVVVDGICDALVLSFFENQRDEDKRSKPWTDRCVISRLQDITMLWWLICSQPNAQSRRRPTCSRHMG
jgi:glutathione S-transferase